MREICRAANWTSSVLYILFIAFCYLLMVGAAFAAHNPKATRSFRPDGFFKPLMNETPYFQTCVHGYTNMRLAVSNVGMIGSESGNWTDCETGEAAVSCEFPAESQQDYLYAASLWIGAVVGLDTMVTVGSEGWRYLYEMWPCADPDCGIVRKSNRPSDLYYDECAKSDLDYIAVYTDTLVDYRWTGSDWEGNPHVPLNLEITQKSYSWSVDYSQDFVLVDFSIKNKGIQDLEKVYAGIYVDGDVSHIANEMQGMTDDICGFKETIPSRAGHGYLDTINLAWIADNDGDPESPDEFGQSSVRGVTGVKVMRTPLRNAKVSFNWWSQDNSNWAFDWGPMMQATKRNYGTGGMGTPEGDRNKHYMMSNGEHDYDQIFAGVDYRDVGWLPPSRATSIQTAMGGDTRYVLSVGPFDLRAFDSLPFTIAYVGGEEFHRSPPDFETYMVNDYNPSAFYETLGFSDIGDNSVWASWVYDNPGYDTDSDGYAGPYWEIEDTLPNGEVIIDTFFYAGDGVPDFRAATAPPPPVLRIRTSLTEINLRFNGLITETAVDPFTREIDFEGYRVYLSRLRRADNFGLLTSHDVVDFKRFMWDSDRLKWINRELPLSLDSILALYGDDFDPECYPCRELGVGFETDDSTIYCFERVDWNQYFADPDGLRKRFADEIEAGAVTSDDDSTIAANWTMDKDPMTGELVRYHKFYEYEYSIDNLLPSVSWYIAVTAFDFGDFETGLPPMESSPLANAVEVWPINDADYVEQQDLKVTVYPNPYRGDAGYAAAGYEDPGGTGFVDHERRIHFVNLPRECTIKVYTVSGDRVVTLNHPGKQSDADSKLTWNLRSKNNELVTSGIYVYVISTEHQSQVGKIVIIL